MKYEDKIRQIKKEKDAIIGELKKELSNATPMSMSATEMEESVVVVEPTSHADTHALQEKLVEKDGLIKTLQEKVGSLFYGFLSGVVVLRSA